MARIVALLVVVGAVAAGCCGWLQVSPAVLHYRISTALSALRAIYTLPDQHVKDFLDSYDLFDQERVTGKTKNEFAQKTINYYQVVNHLCAMGEVEKMYIPPVMDHDAGVFANQIIWEEKGMADKLNIKPNSTVLDMGCGRGRVAHHVASYTGSKVVGLNLDPGQIANAEGYAKSTGLLGKQLEFVLGNYNDPFPFADGTFDALYQVQVLTYAVDPVKLFSEWFRVLKPGSKVSILDYVVLDKFDFKDSRHMDLLRKAKPLLGTVWSPRPKEFTDALEKAGFKIVSSEQASKGGYQWPLFAVADKFFPALTKISQFLVSWSIIPKHFQTLLERLTKDCEAYIEGDKQGLFTTSWQIIAQRPLM